MLPYFTVVAVSQYSPRADSLMTVVPGTMRSSSSTAMVMRTRLVLRARASRLAMISTSRPLSRIMC